jgi:hypothetical protein
LPFNHKRTGQFQVVRVVCPSKAQGYRAVPGGAWARLAGVRRDEVYLLYIELPAYSRVTHSPRPPGTAPKKEGFGDYPEALNYILLLTSCCLHHEH